MGMEAIARRAQLNFGQSDMLLYRRLMPLQFEAGRMLRARSGGLACYPHLMPSKVQGQFQRRPRAQVLQHLRGAARRSQTFLIGGAELHDWQDGFPFLSPTGMTVLVKEPMQLMGEADKKRWVQEAISKSKAAMDDNGEADGQTLESWSTSNRKLLVSLARQGKSYTGAQLFRALKELCGSELLWCSPDADALTHIATMKPGRRLLLTVLGALNLLSPNATDDRHTPSADLYTSLTYEDIRVLLRFESLMAREMDSRTLVDEDVRVGHFACLATKDVTHSETISPGEMPHAVLHIVR